MRPIRQRFSITKGGWISWRPARSPWWEAGKPSRDGLARTRRLVRELVNDDFTVVSGLAAGIDRAAHETAIERNGRTIAVIGTPLSQVYPKGAHHVAAPDRAAVSARQPGTREAVRVTDLPREPAVLSGTQRGDVRAHGGDHHRRSWGNVRHADSGARSPPTGAGRKLFILDSLLPQSAPDVAGTVGDAGCHSGRGVR